MNIDTIMEEIKAEEKTTRQNLINLYRHVSNSPSLPALFKSIARQEIWTNDVYDDLAKQIGSKEFAKFLVSWLATGVSEDSFVKEAVDRYYNIVRNDIYFRRPWAEKEITSLRETMVVGFISTMKDIASKGAAAKTAHGEMSADEPSGGPLGKIAFGEKRKDAPYEEDEPKEKKLFNDISRHVLNYFSEIPPDSVELTKDILKKGKYPKMFRKPKDNVVYRGMGVSEKWLKDALSKSPHSDPDDEIPKSAYEEFSYTFKPRGENPSSSWTSNEDIAFEFSMKERPGADYGVVLYAKKDENEESFLDLRDGIYDIGDFEEEYTRESEIIGLGDIKVFKILWTSLKV